jgi:hypothetical protein
MDYVTISSTPNYWSEIELLSKFPPTNFDGWRWGVDGRDALDREDGRYIIATYSHPIIDPWRRPLIPWKFEDMMFEWQQDDVNEDYDIRITSVHGKLIRLYRKRSKSV